MYIRRSMCLALGSTHPSSFALYIYPGQVSSFSSSCSNQRTNDIERLLLLSVVSFLSFLLIPAFCIASPSFRICLFIALSSRCLSHNHCYQRIRFKSALNTLLRVFEATRQRDLVNPAERSVSGPQVRSKWSAFDRSFGASKHHSHAVRKGSSRL